MNNRLLFTLLLVLCSLHYIQAQGIARISHTKLTEEFGAIYNTGLTLEVGYRTNDFGDKLQVGSDVGLLIARPTRDRFPSYAIGADTFIGGTPLTKVVETNASYHNLTVFLGSIYADYRILEGPFSPFLTTGITANFGTYGFDREGGFITGNEIVEFKVLGLVYGAGLSYKLSDTIEVQLVLSKNKSLATDSIHFSYWKSSIGALYYY